MTKDDIKRSRIMRDYGDTLDKNIISKFSTPWVTPFTIRSILIFINNGWKTTEDFQKQKWHDLIDLPNVGPKTLNFISERLGVDIKFQEPVEPTTELLNEMQGLRSKYGNAMFRRAFYKHFTGR